MTQHRPTTMSPNGYHAETKIAAKAPRNSRGAFAMHEPQSTRPRPKPTQFLAEYERTSWRTFFYNLSRHHFGSAPLTRWISNLLIIGFLVTAVIWLGGWLLAQNTQPRLALLSLLCLAGAMAWGTTLAQLRRQDFVQFSAERMPEVTPSELGTEDKIPVYVTGQFGVEDKRQRYTYLPGFYRTFSTREHALLCQRRAYNFLRFCRWPAEEIGMWYIFVTPDRIQQVRWGQLHFGELPSPAIAIDYQATEPSKRLLQREHTQNETLYLVYQDQEDGLRILSDLLYDLSPDRL